jgi:hypothetical protein
MSQPERDDEASADDARQANPYSSSLVHEDAERSRKIARGAGLLSTTVRRIAVGLFAAPLLLSPLLRYWTFHLAGSWFVSTRIDPDHRRIELGFSYLVLMASVTAICVFLGLLLLFIDKYRRRVVGVLLLPATICMLPALFFFWILLDSYIRNG